MDINVKWGENIIVSTLKGYHLKSSFRTLSNQSLGCRAPQVSTRHRYTYNTDIITYTRMFAAQILLCRFHEKKRNILVWTSFITVTFLYLYFEFCGWHLVIPGYSSRVHGRIKLKSLQHDKTISYIKTDFIFPLVFLIRTDLKQPITNVSNSNSYC